MPFPLNSQLYQQLLTPLELADIASDGESKVRPATLQKVLSESLLPIPRACELVMGFLPNEEAWLRWIRTGFPLINDGRHECEAPRLRLQTFLISREELTTVAAVERWLRAISAPESRMAEEAYFDQCFRDAGPSD